METILASEYEQQRKRRRYWIVVAVVLAVAVIVGAIEFKPISAWVQGVRSRRLATKAEAQMRVGNLREATDQARNAYMIKPDEPMAIRLVAKVQGRTGHFGGAAELWKQLVKLDAATPEDRLEYAENLLLSGSTQEAGREIQKLLRERPDDTPLLRLATRWAVAEGDAAVTAAEPAGAGADGPLFWDFLTAWHDLAPEFNPAVRRQIPKGKWKRSYASHRARAASRPIPST